MSPKEVQPRILFVVPLPPPCAGVEEISQLLVGSDTFDQYELSVLRSNVRDTNAAKGKFDVKGVSRVLSITLRLFWKLISIRPRLVYLTVSQNMSGLLRDCLYIWVARAFERPVVGHFHGSKLAEFLRSKNFLLRWFFIFSLNQASFIIVLSDSIRKSLVPFLSEEKLRVVYNGVEVLPLRPQEGGNGKKPFVVSFMGHFSFAKGFYDILEVVRLLAPDHPEIFFQFAGERLVEERNIVLDEKRGGWETVEELVSLWGPRISMKGIVEGERKKNFFDSSSVFVLPSYAEGMPVSVLEAMASGVPLIISRVGALPEVLTSDNAIFIEPGNIEQIAQGILSLVQKPEKGERMRRANLEKINQFTHKKMSLEIDKIFKKVI